MKLTDVAFDALIPGLILVHLLAAPYTKVEESFNIQATHDVLVYGTPTSNIYDKLSSMYDHFTFPGAVPRTFVGPVVLAGISQLPIALFGFRHAQLIVRAVLGLFNAAALLVMKHNLSRQCGMPTARWYALLQASQFHVMFYASRTLPNMFAFGLTTLAVAFLVPHTDRKATLSRQRLAISLFVFAAVIFRCEIALLLGTNALHLLLTRQTSLQRLIPPFAISFIMALLISVPIDSYFWQKPIWPELWGFYFNAVLGSSSAWGVSPWHYYFTSALPRLLVNPLLPLLFIPLAVVQPATRSTARRLIVPCLAFVAIYSLQPHKEARFIFYVVPPLTAAAAQGANYIFARRSKSLLFAAASSLIVISVMLSFAASTGMLIVSSLNYPGGEALAYLRYRIDEFYQPLPPHLGSSDSDLDINSGAAVRTPTQIRVHADVLSCMTGVTLFGASSGKSVSNTSTVVDDEGRQVSEDHVPLRNLVLDKTEDSPLLEEPNFWVQFDYVLAEDPTAVRGGDWHELGVVEGYAGIEILRPGTEDDVEKAEKRENVVGKGALVAAVRDRVRAVTGGWWVGPRMVPRIHILRRAKAWRAGQDSHRVAYGV